MADPSHQPDGYGTVTAYINISGAADAIAFYTEVFGADERMRMADPESGTVWHAELQIGDSVIMLSDEFPDMNVVSPATLGGTAGGLNVYVEDCDAVHAAALAAGATEIQPPQNQFWGDRSGQVLDPFGHRWNIATHIEDVSAEEIGRRAAEAFG